MQCSEGPVAEHEPAVVWGVRPPEIEMKIHVLAEETSTSGPAAQETLTRHCCAVSVPRSRGAERHQQPGGPAENQQLGSTPRAQAREGCGGDSGESSGPPKRPLCPRVSPVGPGSRADP
ncbi:unnamed protein product [Gadus morhua 'NCC']